MTSPRLEQKILGEGNCFFRAVSFSLTNSEDFHNVIRNSVCNHMIENRVLFQPFLNCEQCVESHISSTRMLHEGTWATEVEIFATAHLLNTDLYTFSGGRWIKFSGNDVEPSMQIRSEGIYLNHHQQNHYNVVLSVNGEYPNMTETQNPKITHEYQKRYRNRSRKKEIRQLSSKMQNKDSSAEKRKQSLRKKYQEDIEFREQKLKTAFVRYLEDEEFQASVRNLSKQRYSTDVEYKMKTKERSRRNSKFKYATDPYHRQKVKTRIIEAYAIHQEYRDVYKKRSIERYATDEQHRDDMKKRSIQKYELNVNHREHVKTKSKLKYKFDELHRMHVNTASSKRYRENENYRKTKLKAAAKNMKQTIHLGQNARLPVKKVMLLVQQKKQEKTTQ